MKPLGIFRCESNQQESISKEFLESIGLDYENVNFDYKDMSKLALAIKEDKDSSVVMLPFCHTLESEALGSKVKYDSELGNRIKTYAINTIEDIDDLKVVDLEYIRIDSLFKAIVNLKDLGERLVLNVTGPITIATGLMDSGLFYKLARKDKTRLDYLLSIIEETIVNIILKGVELGVDIISFADPAGTIDIIGPKLYRDIASKSIMRIFKRIDGQLGDTIIHICGKTSTSLKSVKMIEVDFVINEMDDYFDKLIYLGKTKGVNFTGNWCLKLENTPKRIAICKLI